MALDPNKFTRKTQEAIGAAQAAGRESGHTEITPEHILRALLDQPEGVVNGVLERIGVDVSAVRVRVDEALGRRPQVSGATVRDATLAPAAFQLLETADKERTQLDDEYLSTEHLLLAMTDVTGGVGDLLRSFGITHDSVLDALRQVRGSHRVTSDNPEDQYQALEKYGRALTEAARAGKIDPVDGRDEENRRIIQALSRRTKDKPVLIDELHTIVGAGGAEGAVDAGNMIKPMLARGELRLIGATTLDEYRKYIEKDAALERRFQPVYVGEPSVEDTIAILRGLKERYEVHHGVRIQDAALVAAAVLSDRYITGRQLPDKAIDLVDEAASRLRIEIDSMPFGIDVVERRIRQLEIEKAALAKETDDSSKQRLEALEADLRSLMEERDGMVAHWQSEKDAIVAIQEAKERLEVARTQVERESDLNVAAEIRYGRIPELERRIDEATNHLDQLQTGKRMLKEEVDAEDIAEVVSKWTGVPVSRLMEGEMSKLVHLEDHLHNRVIGQDEAVVAV